MRGKFPSDSKNYFTRILVGTAGRTNTITSTAAHMRAREST
jgi:hypothetical protein